MPKTKSPILFLISLSLTCFLLAPSAMAQDMLTCIWQPDVSNPPSNGHCIEQPTLCPDGQVPVESCDSFCRGHNPPAAVCYMDKCVGSVLCVTPGPTPINSPTPTPEVTPPPTGCNPAIRNYCSQQAWDCSRFTGTRAYCSTTNPSDALCCTSQPVGYGSCAPIPPSGNQCTTHRQCQDDYDDDHVIQNYCNCVIPGDGSPPYCLNELWPNSFLPSWIRRYVPYSTLEDTTGEFTVSVIPDVQPTDIDGQIVAMGMSIDYPSDSRLYFPHVRSAVALSEILNSLHQPLPPTPTPAFNFRDPEHFAQPVGEHQGIDDTTPYQLEYYDYPDDDLGEVLIRNTEVIEGAPAPPPLYTPEDPLCSLAESRINTGDSLLGQEVNATFTYYQLFELNPELYIGCSAPLRTCAGISNCVTRPCMDENASGCVGAEAQYSGGHNNDGCCASQIGLRCTTSSGDILTSYCEEADANYYCTPPDRNCSNGDTWDDKIGISCGPDPATANFRCCGPNTDPTFACRESDLCSMYDPPPDSCDLCSTADTPEECSDPFIDLWCDWVRIRDGYNPVPNPGSCPVWPTVTLDSGARASTFSKTPFIEKLYRTLITDPQSFFRRWLPSLPLSNNFPGGCIAFNSMYAGLCATFTTQELCGQNASFSCSWQEASPEFDLVESRNQTVPAATIVGYSASTPDLQNTRYTAGNGGSVGAMYFPFLGSLADYLLATPDNQQLLNLQRVLRPRGFMPEITLQPATGDINCNQNLPQTDIPCVDRNTYFERLNRWTNNPAVDSGNHAEICYNDVITRANAAGVNPGISLLIWANESGASNYNLSPVEDFGVHVGDYNQPDNFDRQITGHLLTIPAIASRCSAELSACGTDDACKAGVFAAVYLTGNGCIPNASDIDYGNMILGEWHWFSSCSFPFP